MTSYEKECASGSSQHSKARSLAYVLDIRIDIVQYEASSLKQTQINKRQTDGPDAKVHGVQELVLLGLWALIFKRSFYDYSQLRRASRASAARSGSKGTL